MTPLLRNFFPASILLIGILGGCGKVEVLRVERDSESRQIVVYEGDRPVLQYNDHIVSAPEGFSTNPNSLKYAVPRSNYIHPLYGLDGQILTEDFTEDHPHHRGIYWAWPEVTWQGQTGDLHALQKVFARPIAPATWEILPDCAELLADLHWLWEDKTPIVRETVTIRVWPSQEEGQFIDTAFTFEAIDKTVTLGRRKLTTYGGLNIRLAPIENLKLYHYSDGKQPAWSDCSGIWEGSEESSGITVFESAANPDYPGDYIEYPHLPWFQPAFPRSGQAYPLEKGHVLILQYRFWIRRGGPVSDKLATKLWYEYQQSLQIPFALQE